MRRHGPAIDWPVHRPDDAGDVVVQFRAPNSALDTNLLQSIEKAYASFTPCHKYEDRLGQLHVYTMNNIEGTCMYLARDELQDDNCRLLRRTIDDCARFLASAHHNTPGGMERPDPTQLLAKHSSQPRRLREGLPERFRPTLGGVVPPAPGPLRRRLAARAQTTLACSITICTWTGPRAGSRASATGGKPRSPRSGRRWGGWRPCSGRGSRPGDCWRWRPSQQVLRDRFWAAFYGCLGGASGEQKRRVETARLAGLFLVNGLEWDGHGNMNLATEESLDAFSRRGRSQALGRD